MEPAEFLRHQPPFDQLGPAAFRMAESALEVVYLPRGEAVLRRGGARAEHLWVLRKGTVRLERDGEVLQVLEEGDAFAFPSLIGRTSPHVDVIAAEDVLAYRIPAAVFDQLMDDAGFREFFLLDLSDRLRRSAALHAPPLGLDLGRDARALVAREPVAVPAAATVGEAARVMRERGVSSVLVGDGPDGPAGILTDRDLRSRVLAEGQGPETAVASVMSAPVATLDAGATLFDVLLLMLDRRVHHVPLAESGRIVGVLTDTDLLRAQVQSPLALLKRVASGDPGELGGYGGSLVQIVDSLFGAGLEASRIGRVVSRLNDALAAALLRRAEAELGPPPAPYAWIVYGSEGRMEQTLLTDQDNALVYADAGEGHERWYEALAARMRDGLRAAGFPDCPGGFMASQWRMPLARWREQFRGWIATPDPQALLDASSFFDWRAVHGTLDLAPLVDVARRAARERTFLAHLARTALGFTPPLGAFRQIRLDHGGVDLKKGGLMPIVGLARLFALESGASARGTLERLAAASAAGVLSDEGATTLSEAFRFVLRLRLRDQLQSVRAGREPHAVARFEGLTSLERGQLKDVFHAVREVQESVRLRFATDRLG
ncbi:MAG: DUF294 nucleotidyltransferase-like domain-containing protein [Candidatus Eisenbacteria bacterium]